MLTTEEFTRERILEDTGIEAHHTTARCVHRFLRGYEKRPNGCWEWTGELNIRGYGKCQLLGEVGAHRVSYTVFKGDIPKDTMVLHGCDNKLCVNPQHLHLGDHAQNMREATARGRRPYGEKAGAKRYTESQVKDIIRRRHLGERSTALAKEYGV